MRILSYTRSPFGLEFKGEAGLEYEVEATGEQREWGVIKTYNGNGSAVKFIDTRKALFER